MEFNTLLQKVTKYAKIPQNKSHKKHCNNKMRTF